MSEPAGAWGSLRRSVRQIGPARLALATQLLLARFGWSIPLLDDAERLLFDARSFVTAPRVAQDDRITLVVHTIRTRRWRRRASARRSIAPSSRARMAIDAMRPKAIGIDLMIDQAQPEDPALVAAFRRLRTPTFLAFATHAATPDDVRDWQEAHLRDLFRRIGPGAVRPASIRIVPDDDGVMRHWPDRPAGMPPLLADALAGGAGGRGTIRYAAARETDRPRFAAIPIDLLARPEAAALLRPQVAGRTVLIGGDISDIDQFAVPASRYPDASGRSGATVPGLGIHAAMLAQRLDGTRPVPLPDWSLWLAAALVVGCAGVTAAARLRLRWSGLVIAAQLGAVDWITAYPASARPRAR